MAIPDIINGCFEAFASLFILNHARVLWKSKQAHGVSMLSTWYFMLWGVWNMWYYPHLGQYFSFAGGVVIVLAQLFWIWSIWKIRKETQ